MDDKFIRRTYRSIVLAWIIALTWALAFQKLWIALSISVGVILGTAILTSNNWIIPRVLQQDISNPKRKLAKIWLLKYPIMIVALYLVLRWDKINGFALCGGVVLVHLAIVLRSLSAAMIKRR